MYWICRVMGDRPGGELHSLERDMICIRRKSPGADENDENDEKDHENDHENIQAIFNVQRGHKLCTK
jgi:hypothetical protein